MAGTGRVREEAEVPVRLADVVAVPAVDGQRARARRRALSGRGRWLIFQLIEKRQKRPRSRISRAKRQSAAERGAEMHRDARLVALTDSLRAVFAPIEIPTIGCAVSWPPERRAGM
jgi:hypothetical protein